MKTEMQRSVGYALAGIVAALLMVWLRYWLNQRFFFIDDAQSQFYPGIHEIARLIEAGQSPWISLRSWYAGNIAGDYIYGIFNPVSLLSIWVVGGADDLALAATAFVSVYVASSALGAFFLARLFNAGPAYAGVVGFAAATNNFLIYWYGAAWVPGLVGFSWTIWATYFVLKAATDGKYIFPAAITVYLLITAGYPASIVGLAIFLACYLAIDLWQSRRWAATLRICVAGICGSLMALPALVPAWAQFFVSLRADVAAISVTNSFLSADFPGLVSFAFPSFLPVMKTWGPMFSGKFGVVEMPFYYVGWFPLLGFVYLDWRAAWNKSQMTLFVLAATTAVLMVVCMLPSFPLFRWSFKYIPYYSLALALLGAHILSDDRLLRITRIRTGILLVITVLLTVGAIFYSPTRWPVHLLFFALMSVAAIGFFILKQRTEKFADLHVVVVSVMLTALTCVFWQKNSELSDPGVVDKVSEIHYLGSEGQNLTVFNATDIFCCDAVQRQYFAHGNTGYLSENQFINGYATMQPARLSKELCLRSPWGTVCEQAAERLFAVDDGTGLKLSNLLGLDVIVVQDGAIANQFERLAGAEWEVYRSSPYGRAYKRRISLDDMGGTVAWVPPGVHISANQQDHLRETIELSIHESYRGEPLIFQRAWHPGYEASIAGKNLSVEAYRGFMVALRLPEGTAPEEKLELSYRLPGMPWSLYLAILALIISAIASVLLSNGSDNFTIAKKIWSKWL